MVPPGFEPGSAAPEPAVLTTTLWNRYSKSFPDKLPVFSLSYSSESAIALTVLHWLCLLHQPLCACEAIGPSLMSMSAWTLAVGYWSCPLVYAIPFVSLVTTTPIDSIEHSADFFECSMFLLISNLPVKGYQNPMLLKREGRELGSANRLLRVI